MDCHKINPVCIIRIGRKLSRGKFGIQPPPKHCVQGGQKRVIKFFYQGFSVRVISPPCR